ncbi:MAG: energy-dependent translational throttle protein EttA [Kiritimatiellae bacterium]|jgi:sulfate-transporting ATPase|nr:energy-dependent translational throttle protein EttA [Kiritimatiellia bacterium]MDD3583739.1 energy-dependent translational throttle protein EttA [Kiritimatiellia bacterium]HHU16553.1 energy-dependent translational throttle protein EttA [Lentisphaerota bacterium]HON48750.1 energy-dependent translational throttle protein EttA [Kiritimatiellia bacterium]
MAGEYVFSLINVTKQHEKKTILEDVNLSFFHGAHIGVIGANGSGKSSLLKILAGLDTEFMGECQIAKNTKIGFLPQEPELDTSKTVMQCVEEGVAGSKAILARYDEICELLGSDLSDDESEKLNDELGRLQDTIDMNDLWNLDHQIEMAMEALRLPPSDAPVAPLSGGERRRVALCRLLISNPDVLLLDEPTNHLDAESVAWLETYLKGFKGTLIVVTHDRYFLSNVTEWILELDNGRTYPYKGNYEAWLQQKQEAMLREAKQAESRRKLIENELAWVRTNPSGRRAKNQARVRRYEELAAQQVSTREDDLRIQIPAGPRLGDLVVKADEVSMGFGDNLLFENMSFDLPRGGIVGVIGGNGAGKTTLFKLITGQLQPLSGTLTVGPSVQLSYVDQLRDDLNPDNTVYEEITGGEEFVTLGRSEGTGAAPVARMNGRAYCSRFNFRGAEQQKRVGVLSGGERNRVHLAKLLRSGGNLLLLDEPSNDLDVATLRSLEEGLADFGGCVMVISHDRWFLDRIATHILAFEGDCKVTWFEGNYADYHEHRRKLLGDAADRPTRVRFRPLKHG